MNVRRLAIAGVIAGGALFALGGANATPNLAGAQPASPAPLVEQAQYGGGYYYCRRVRIRCADRWGWGTWQWRRCVRDRGCSSGYGPRPYGGPYSRPYGGPYGGPRY